MPCALDLAIDETNTGSISEIIDAPGQFSNTWSSYIEFHDRTVKC